MHDLFEHSEQQLHVGIEGEAAGHVTRAATQPRVRLRIPQR
jgi:hypothetical protein